mgnify:FL=1
MTTYTPAARAGVFSCREKVTVVSSTCNGAYCSPYSCKSPLESLWTSEECRADRARVSAHYFAAPRCCGCSMDEIGGARRRTRRTLGGCQTAIQETQEHRIAFSCSRGQSGILSEFQQKTLGVSESVSMVFGYIHGHPNQQNLSEEQTSIDCGSAIIARSTPLMTQHTVWSFTKFFTAKTCTADPVSSSSRRGSSQTSAERW